MENCERKKLNKITKIFTFTCKCQFFFLLFDKQTKLTWNTIMEQILIVLSILYNHHGRKYLACQNWPMLLLTLVMTKNTWDVLFTYFSKRVVIFCTILTFLCNLKKCFLYYTFIVPTLCSTAYFVVIWVSLSIFFFL